MDRMSSMWRRLGEALRVIKPLGIGCPECKVVYSVEGLPVDRAITMVCTDCDSQFDVKFSHKKFTSRIR